MKFIQFTFLILSTLFLFSCKCDCPDSYELNAHEVPNWTKEDIDLYDVSSMTFLSSLGDTLNLKRYLSSRDEIDRTKVKSAECAEDETKLVDIYYYRTWNRVFFSSDNGDTLGFQYYTQLPSLYDFSFEGYDRINNDDPYPMFAMYRNVVFLIDGLYYSITLLARKKGEDPFKIYLEEDFKQDLRQTLKMDGCYLESKLSLVPEYYMVPNW